MSESKRFLRSGILLTLVGLTMRTVAMLHGAFVSRVVGAEGIGIFTLVMTVYSFALTLATSGISLTVTRLVASAIGDNRPERISVILRGSVIYSFSFGLLSTLLLYFCAGILGRFVFADDTTVLSLRILSLSLIPASISAALSGYFVGVKRVEFNAITSILCQGIKVLITVFIIRRLTSFGMLASVAGLCAAITTTEILGFLLVFFEFLYDRRKKGPVKSIPGFELSAVVKEALPLAFSAYVRSLLLNIEHALIPKRLRDGGETESEAYAHYGTLHGMALPVITYPMTPLSSFAGLLVPEFAEDMSAGRCERMSRVASRALNLTLTYAVISSVFLLCFSEELGYSLYKSYDAGYYISALAFIVPIMYLDHVTDSMLKGIGEQVFSMWVNITDSLLSVILVWLLIPRMGILGYALVIVIMEGYNFILSFLRLRKKIKFKLSLLRSLVYPLILSLFSAQITCALFNFSGSTSKPWWVIMKMIFALATVIFAYAVSRFMLLTLNQRKKNVAAKAPPQNTICK